MRTAPVIPVLVIDNLDDAVPLAEALVAGGLKVLEVTLRTPCALDAIRAMKQVPGAIVGAGTVLNPDDLAPPLTQGPNSSFRRADPAFGRSRGRWHPLPSRHGQRRRHHAGHGSGPQPLLEFFPAEASGGVSAL
jgi:2-dehydro-3-deoxyphosphogluconate aldolase/(4S)-4-hydroxy-2-oxoglutarate aldolase